MPRWAQGGDVVFLRGNHCILTTAATLANMMHPISTVGRSHQRTSVALLWIKLMNSRSSSKCSHPVKGILWIRTAVWNENDGRQRQRKNERCSVLEIVHARLAVVKFRPCDISLAFLAGQCRAPFQLRKVASEPRAACAKETHDRNARSFCNCTFVIRRKNNWKHTRNFFIIKKSSHKNMRSSWMCMYAPRLFTSKENARNRLQWGRAHQRFPSWHRVIFTDKKKFLLYLSRAAAFGVSQWIDTIENTFSLPRRLGVEAQGH